MTEHRKLTEAEKAARATRKVIRRIRVENLVDADQEICEECGVAHDENEDSNVLGSVGPQDLMSEGDFAWKYVTETKTNNWRKPGRWVQR